AMLARGLILLISLSFSLLADEFSLIRVGQTWSYFKGQSEPSTPAEAWRGLGFDDSHWLKGISGFSYGYAPYDEATVLADMPGNYSAVYFRKKFVLTNLATVKWFVLRADYDHGFVAYLNGTEIARRGLAGDPGSTVP